MFYFTHNFLNKIWPHGQYVTQIFEQLHHWFGDVRKSAAPVYNTIFKVASNQGIYNVRIVWL